MSPSGHRYSILVRAELRAYFGMDASGNIHIATAGNGVGSDVGQLAKIFVVLGEAAFALADRPDILDELDRPNPLDHLEAELIFYTQPQRRSV